MGELALTCEGLEQTVSLPAFRLFLWGCTGMHSPIDPFAKLVNGQKLERIAEFVEFYDRNHAAITVALQRLAAMLAAKTAHRPLRSMQLSESEVIGLVALRWRGKEPQFCGRIDNWLREAVRHDQAIVVLPSSVLLSTV